MSTQANVESRASTHSYSLDPVTFEVLKNSFSTAVDLMSEQILRTCYSFVIYARDFSSALCDADGNTVMQGSKDIAVHVGTLHFQCQAILEAFGEDINPDDVFAVNDPYRGGTHLNDVSFVRPIFAEGELIAFAQNKGHWADIGGNVPGSFDVKATAHFSEGLLIPPLRVWHNGRLLHDVAQLLTENTRAPFNNAGDLHAQAMATGACEREVLRLVDKYGKDTVTTALQEVQNYVERIVRGRVADLPDGTWQTQDYIDLDPSQDEGMIPVQVALNIQGDQISYDLTGSGTAIASFLNAGYGTAFSGIVAGTKTFFPDVPLNSGFYRAIHAELGPEGTVVNAGRPYAVTGFCSGPYEKIMNAIFEIWSDLIPERAIACSFNLEYLLVGGHDTRIDERPYFMWYDWKAGGWGGRNGKDGANATSPIFGVGLAIQPLEGQERLCPVVTTEHQIVTDSGGPGQRRGGCGVHKGGTMTGTANTVMSYCCDRARSVTWGIYGGLPSIPHGVWVNPEREDERFLGAVFSNEPIGSGDTFTRPSAGGGGYGDALERAPQAVCEDVADGYVTMERACKDYGVVVEEVDAELAAYQVDHAATSKQRSYIRHERRGWLQTDPEEIARRYRIGELDTLDLVRHYGVILDWNTGELLPNTTEQFRQMLHKRTVPSW